MPSLSPSHSRLVRLPLAVIIAGSLAVGGLASVAVPANAATAAKASISANSTDVAPVKSFREFAPVTKGEENVRINNELSKPLEGAFVYDVKEGLVADGETLLGDSSMAPNTGWTYEVSVRDGKIFNDPDGFWFDESRTLYSQVNNWFYRTTAQDGANPSTTPIGGAVFVPSGALSVQTWIVDELGGLPLLPTGEREWKFNVPDTMFDLSGATIKLEYWGDNGAGSDGQGEMITLPISDFSVTNGVLTLSHPSLPQLTANGQYYLSIASADESKRGSVYVGLYESGTDPIDEPTDNPPKKHGPKPPKHHGPKPPKHDHPKPPKHKP